MTCTPILQWMWDAASAVKRAVSARRQKRHAEGAGARLAVTGSESLALDTPTGSKESRTNFFC